MRRIFIRPTMGKLLLAIFLTALTYIYINAGLGTVSGSEAAFRLGVNTAYLWIGPTNPILKVVVISLFWFVIAWITYSIMYGLESAYAIGYRMLIRARLGR